MNARFGAWDSENDQVFANASGVWGHTDSSAEVLFSAQTDSQQSSHTYGSVGDPEGWLGAVLIGGTAVLAKVMNMRHTAMISTRGAMAMDGQSSPSNWCENALFKMIGTLILQSRAPGAGSESRLTQGECDSR